MCWLVALIERMLKFSHSHQVCVYYNLEKRLYFGSEIFHPWALSKRILIISKYCCCCSDLVHRDLLFTVEKNPFSLVEKFDGKNILRAFYGDYTAWVSHDQNCSCCEVLSSVLEWTGADLARFEPWKIVLCISAIKTNLFAALSSCEGRNVKVKISDRFFSPPQKKQSSVWLLQNNYTNANSKDGSWLKTIAKTTYKKLDSFISTQIFRTVFWKVISDWTEACEFQMPG